jgi:hypothetical protein
MSGKCAFLHDKKYGDEFGSRSLSFKKIETWYALKWTVQMKERFPS